MFALPDLALRPGSAKPHQRRKNAAGVQRRLAATSTGEYRAAGGTLADFKYDLQHDYLTFVRPPHATLEQSSFLSTALVDGGNALDCPARNLALHGALSICRSPWFLHWVQVCIVHTGIDFSCPRCTSTSSYAPSAQCPCRCFSSIPAQCYLLAQHGLQAAKAIESTPEAVSALGRHGHQLEDIEQCLLAHVNYHVNTSGQVPDIFLQVIESPQATSSNLQHEHVHYVDTELAQAPMHDRPLVNQTSKPTVGEDEHLVTPQDVVIDETRLSCLKDVKPEDRMPYIKAIAKEIFDVVRFGCFKLSLLLRTRYLSRHDLF